MIFYFSGTGNSLAAARYLEKELAERKVDITKAVREKKFSYEIGEEESVGFVFPVYFWGLPSIVAYFLHRVCFQEDRKPYLYGVMTCGSSIGRADKQMKTILEKRGHQLKAVFPLVMPDNYVVMFQAPTEEEVEKILKKTEKEIAVISASVKRKEDGRWSKAKGFALSAVMQPLYRNGRKTAKFHAEDTCISCGKCASICPARAIRIEDGKPIWVKKQCIFCMACINRCPVQAIQYGSRTLKKGRYEHPGIKGEW